jgi:hypothetical protein
MKFKMESHPTLMINGRKRSGGHLNNLFSQLIINSNFNSPQKVGSVWARYSLKQLWEECCTEANEIGLEGVKESEDQLLSLWGYCNQMKVDEGKKSTRMRQKFNHYTSKKEYFNDLC